MFQILKLNENTYSYLFYGDPCEVICWNAIRGHWRAGDEQRKHGQPYRYGQPCDGDDIRDSDSVAGRDRFEQRSDVGGHAVKRVRAGGDELQPADILGGLG